MPIEFRCRQCGRLLKTPDDTAGRQAQCPACGALSTVPGVDEPKAPLPAEGPPAPGPWAEPVEDSGAPSTPWPPRPAGYQTDYTTPFAGDVAQRQDELRRFAAARVSAPATALTVVAMLNLILQSMALMLAIVVSAMGPNLGGINPNRHLMAHQAASSLVAAPIQIAISIFLLIAATRMKRLENYGLALAGAIVAAIPCTAPCCLVGVGFGIWALVVLCDANVKSAFRS